MRVATYAKLLAVSAIMSLASVSFGAPILITGVFDGPLTGGEPKVVELFVCEDIADLSDYAVGAANNLGGTDGAESFLPAGPVSAGTFVYIVDQNTGNGFNPYFGFTPSIIVDSNAGINGGAAAINGDDAIELFFDPTGSFNDGGETVVDTFGNISGPVTGWNYLDGWAYRNDLTGPDGATFVAANWTFSGVDATDGQMTNGEVGGSFFPIGTYVCIPEPTSLALVGLAGFALVGCVRRRS